MTATPYPIAASPDGLNNTELAWAVLVDPRRAFTALREQPRFWFPLLVTAVLYALFFVWYYNVVDIAWLGDHMMNGDPRMKSMSEADKASAAAAMSKGLLMGSSLLALVLGTTLLRVIEAAYFLLAGKASSLRLSFKHWMALTCWSAWPHILLVLVMSFAVLTHRNGQIAPEQLYMLSWNELVFHTAVGTPWNTLLATLTVLHPWVWWLTALAVRVWTGRSWVFSTLFALVPELVLYGIWALMAALS